MAVTKLTSTTQTFPELMLIAPTLGMLGAGVALLISKQGLVALKPRELRKSINELYALSRERLKEDLARERCLSSAIGGTHTAEILYRDGRECG